MGNTGGRDVSRGVIERGDLLHRTVIHRINRIRADPCSRAIRRSWRLPQPGDRQGVEALAEGKRRFSVPGHRTLRETLAERVPEPAETTEVTGPDRCRGLDFDSGDGAREVFENDVDVRAVPVAKMRESGQHGMPARLPSQVLEDEGFEELAEASAITFKRAGIDAGQGRSKAGVGQWSFGFLISRFRRLLYQTGRRSIRKSPSSSVTWRPAEFESRGESAEIVESGCPGRCRTQECGQGIEDPAEAVHVALDQRVHIVTVPVGASGGREPADSRR